MEGIAGKMKIKFRLNGRLINADIPGGMRLIDLLREDFNLTGTREGCGKGECGACTVLLDGKPVNSCLVLAAQLKGRAMVTIEGLSDGDTLNPVQRAFLEATAVQCGFCSPGLILAAKSLLDKYPDPSEEQIKRAISGNLCRCTGYSKVFKAIKMASETHRNSK